MTPRGMSTLKYHFRASDSRVEGPIRHVVGQTVS